MDSIYAPERDRSLETAPAELIDRFSDEALDQDRGTLSMLALPLAFFFAPGKFMRSFGVHISTGFLNLIVLIVGASSIIGTFETKLGMGNSMIWFPESWGALALVALIGGYIRGWVIYGLGGLWFRARLHMCGTQGRSAPWSQTTRVYMSAGIAKHSVGLLFLIVASLRHDSFIAYIQNESAFAAFLALGVISVFEIWSSITLYCGVRAVFNSKRIWALLWFLILPVAIRVFVLGGIFVLAAFASLAPEPQIDRASSFKSPGFSFQYPSNWFVTQDTDTPGPEIWVTVEPILGDAYYKIEIVDAEPGVDLLESSRDNLETYGSVVFAEESTEFSKAGRYPGRGRSYKATIEGNAYVIRLFEADFDQWSRLLITEIVHESAFETLAPGFELVMNTLRVSDFMSMPPRVEQTYTARHELIDFEIPINWWYTLEVGDPYSDDEGNEYQGGITMAASTPGRGYFRVDIYNSSRGPRSELGATIDNYTDGDRLVGEEHLDEWLGLTGIGSSGRVDLESVMWELSVLVSELPDGRLLEVRKAVPREDLSIQSPGFDLIERTFIVREP